MKTTSPKIIAIGLVLLTNVVAGYIYTRQNDITPRAATVDSLTDENGPKGVVKEATLKHNGELQICYETFLERMPVIDEGKVEMHWLLEKTGRISSLELVRTELNDQELIECMIEKLNAMTFRAPKNPMLVSHKFNFKKRSPSSVTFR